jgi:hypothetical protein
MEVVDDMALSTKTNEMKAEYCVRKGWGYQVMLYRWFESDIGGFWEDVVVREGSNDVMNAHYYGVSGINALDRNQLAKRARKIARQMLIKYDCPTGKIVYNGDLLPSTKLLRGW